LISPPRAKALVADLDLSFHLFRCRAPKCTRVRSPVEIWALYLYAHKSTWLHTRVYPHTSTSLYISKILKEPYKNIRESYKNITHTDHSPPPPPPSGDRGKGDGRGWKAFVGVLQYSKTRRTLKIYQHIWNMTWCINHWTRTWAFELIASDLHVSTQTHTPVNCYAGPKKGMRPCCPTPLRPGNCRLLCFNSCTPLRPTPPSGTWWAPVLTPNNSRSWWEIQWGCRLEVGFLDNMQEKDSVSPIHNEIRRKRWGILFRELNEDIWRLPPLYVCVSVRKWGGQR